ncbi:MAG: ribonuclease HII [Endomicrobia bacterium]|nr:ribonuclease HII [Endomicrobiia bacterium]MCL2506068.1 ribonuclease HII [Endomicrobiia bacterium]
MDLFVFDKNYYEKGFKFVAGVDEAGRGPLAGPVTAAAVILPQGIEIPYLNDSKKLTEKKRTILFDIIKEKALAYFISSVDNTVIDEVNILQATFIAMKNSVEGLNIKPELCLIDGNHKIPDLKFNQEAVIDGDAKSAVIAAASVLAKVTRDRLMLEYSRQYPLYKFEKHKGYGTPVHMEALKTYGACPIHRKSFAPVKLYSGNSNG